MPDWAPYDDDHRRVLLAAATETIGRALVDGALTLPEGGDDPELTRSAATFVTLEREAALLGCVGTLDATEPLVTSVGRQAWNAAFADRRMPGVTRDDFAVMSVKVSVLSPLTRVRARSWRDVHRVLRPGVDGVVVNAGSARATLLPSVWAKLSDPAEFLDVLWHKAGLRARDWLPGTRVHRYVTAELADPGPRVLAEPETWLRTDILDGNPSQAPNRRNGS